MAQDRMSRQELRAPDAFQRVGVGAESWMAQRKTAVVVGVVALLGVFFVVMLARISPRGRRRRPAPPWARPSGCSPGRSEADLPAGATEGPQPFKSEKERDQAAAAALAGVLSTNPGTRRRAHRHVPLAATEVRLGQLDAALATSTGISGAPRRPSRCGRRRSRGQGHAREAKGELPRRSSPTSGWPRRRAPGSWRAWASTTSARILVLQGKKEEAARPFAELAGREPRHRGGAARPRSARRCWRPRA